MTRTVSLVTEPIRHHDAFVAMSRRTSPELLAIPMVLIAAAFFGLLFWAVYANTALLWTLLILFTLTVVVVGLAFILRRPPREPADLRAASPGDGVVRTLVILDGGTGTTSLGGHVRQAAGERPARVLVIAPTLSSRLDWLTGEQTVYDDAAAQLDAALTSLAAAGIEADGRTGAHEPMQAVADSLREFPADAIIVVTPPERSGEAKWDELSESLRQRTGLPVTLIG